jgi:hypothetical protein
MVTSVAARFHFDGEAWPLTRLERWYRRHVALYHEEQEEIAKAREAAKNGKR